MTWTEETRATLETYAEEGTMPPYAREAIGAALAEIERLHAGLKSGADWIRENLPDTKDGQFVVDVLLAEIVRLKTELAQQAEECEGHLTYGDDPNLIRAALTQAKLEKAEARVRTLEAAHAECALREADLLKELAERTARIRTLEDLVSRALELGDRGFLLNPECDWAIEARAALSGEGKP